MVCLSINMSVSYYMVSLSINRSLSYCMVSIISGSVSYCMVSQYKWVSELLYGFSHLCCMCSIYVEWVSGDQCICKVYVKLVGSLDTILLQGLTQPDLVRTLIPSDTTRLNKHR